MAKKKVVFNEYDQDQRLILAKRRRRKRIRRFFKRLFLIMTVFLVCGYFLSSFSKIMTVTVTGTELISEDDVKELSGVTVAESYFLLTTVREVENRILASEYFDEVKVSKTLDRNLTITVVETPLVCYQASGDGYRVVNEFGKIFQVAPGLESNLLPLPVMHDFTDEIFSEFAVEYVKIPAQVRYQISDIFFIPEDGDPLKCQFNMDDGKILYVRIDKMADQLADNKYLLNIQKNPDYKYYDYLGRFIYME